MPESPLPPDPITSLAAGAAQHSEMVETYVKAGFTRAEAMDILLTIMKTVIATTLGGGQ